VVRFCCPAAPVAQLHPGSSFHDVGLMNIACFLYELADADMVAIGVAAGALERIVALLGSPNAGVQEAAAGALWDLAGNGAPLQQVVSFCLQCVGFIIAHAVVSRISRVLLKF
jgi:hypothetical protein